MNKSQEKLDANKTKQNNYFERLERYLQVKNPDKKKIQSEYQKKTKILGEKYILITFSRNKRRLESRL